MATKYTVLRRKDNGYMPVGTVEKHNPQAAVRAIAEETLESGTYLAIPSRSFIEIPVQVQQETRISIGESTAPLYVVGGEDLTPPDLSDSLE